MSNQLTGRADIYVDGMKLPMEDGATLNPGGQSRKSERHGDDTYYTEEGVAPTVSGNVLHNADVDIIALSAIKNATVMFHADTGHKFMLRGAFVTEPVVLDAKGGQSPISFAARSCDKV
jgi:hypothetical protein